MKKLMSVILAATMAFGLAATAMAEDPATTQTNTANSGAGSQAVTIAYEVPETFTWTIPDLQNIELHPVNNVLELNMEESIGISDCYLASNHHIALGLTYSSYAMEDPDNKNGAVIGFDIKMKGTGPFHTWVRPTDGSINVPFKISLDQYSSYDDWFWAGTWKTNITFTAEIWNTNSESDIIHTDEEMELADFVKIR